MKRLMQKLEREEACGFCAMGRCKYGAQCWRGTGVDSDYSAGSGSDEENEGGTCCGAGSDDEDDRLVAAKLAASMPPRQDAAPWLAGKAPMPEMEGSAMPLQCENMYAVLGTEVEAEEAGLNLFIDSLFIEGLVEPDDEGTDAARKEGTKAWMALNEIENAPWKERACLSDDGGYASHKAEILKDVEDAMEGSTAIRIAAEVQMAQKLDTLRKESEDDRRLNDEKVARLEKQLELSCAVFSENTKHTHPQLIAIETGTREQSNRKSKRNQRSHRIFMPSKTQEQPQEQEKQEEPQDFQVEQQK